MDNSAAVLKNALHKGIDKLFLCFQPKIMQPLNLFASPSYIYSNQGAQSVNERESFLPSLIDSITEAIHAYSPMLVDKTLETFIRTVMEFLASRLEREVFKKKFDMMGALQV